MQLMNQIERPRNNRVHISLPDACKQQPNVNRTCRYPYLLPNVVVGALALLSLLLTKFFLKETLRVESVRSR